MKVVFSKSSDFVEHFYILPFFISHIVLKLLAFEDRLQNPSFSTKSIQKATLRVRGINSNSPKTCFWRYFAPKKKNLPHKFLLNVRKGYIFEKFDFGRFSRQNTKMLFSCQPTLGLIKTCRLSHKYLRVESEGNQFKISQ